MDEPTTYAIVEAPRAFVLPMDKALELFRLLGHGMPVEYDWSNKEYKPDHERDLCTLKSFSLAQWAALQLHLQ